MSYQQREPENGTIFLSEFKSQNPKAPQFKGKGKDDQGRDIEIAYWEGKSQAGKPWKRVVISKPYEQGNRQRGAQQMREAVDRNVSDVPTGPANPPVEEDDVPF